MLWTTLRGKDVEVRSGWRLAKPVPVVLFALVLALQGVSVALAQTVAGSVTALTGSAQLLRAGTTSNVAQAMAVQVADRITTAPASHLTITLTDASKLDLGESSTLAIDEHVLGAGGGRVSTKLSLFSGFVRSLVNLTASGSPNFEVHTPNAVAAARGTDFATGYQEGLSRPGYSGCNRFTDVAVYKGLVGLTQTTTPSAIEQIIPEGYESSVPCGLPPLPPGPLGMTGASSVAAAAAGGHAGGAGGAGALGAGGVGISPPPVGAPPPICPPVVCSACAL